MINGVAINPLSQKQFIDHLAPLAASLRIPYLFHDQEQEERVKANYPELNTIFLPYEEFSPEYLISHFACTFLSDQWEKKVFDAKFRQFEEAYGKKMRNVHCPHGFSDKGFYLRGVAFEDISLIYGQNMLDLLKEWGVLQNLRQFVLCGNYRLAYYQRHKSFYDKMIKGVLQFKKTQPIILYAPTCIDLEDSSSFFSASLSLLKNLPNHFNLIVKPHPQLEETNPGEFYHIMSLFEGKENILFLRDFFLIYPLLSAVDIYLGDMSSIGYDFLSFDRPMFFLNEQRRNIQNDRGLYLFRCGMTVNPEDYSQIFTIIENSLVNDKKIFSKLRKETNLYTFGNEIPISKIEKDLARELEKNDLL